MGDRTPMTDEQQRLYDWVAADIARHGRSPTLAEMAAGLGRSSTRAVSYHLERMEAAGWVRRRPGARGLELLGPDAPARLRLAPAADHSIPLRGKVGCDPAGVENADEDGRLVFAELFAGDGLAAWVAVGTSMLDAQIRPGDYVVVREDPEPPSGSIVVAMLDRSMVCKKLVRLGKKKCRLVSLHPEVLPVVVDDPRTHFRVLGVYVGVIRKV